jgi:hypothetical protein
LCSFKYFIVSPFVKYIKKDAYMLVTSFFRNHQVFKWRGLGVEGKRIVEVVVLPRFANNVEAEL